MLNAFCWVVLFFCALTTLAADQSIAIFAGGCFWCMQPEFDQLPGVVSTTVGYTGGNKENPTYEEVSSGKTGHFEAIEVVYDPSKISYQQLLNVYWHNIDPTNNKGQFCDIGPQYRSAIFYHDATQKKLAGNSREELLKSHRVDKVYTEILPEENFYPAEEYHQEYYKKNPTKYKFYRYNCGRDQRLNEIWGKSA